MIASFALAAVIQFVPPGPLPWPVPEFDDPTVAADETSTPTISLSDLQTSDDYATQEAYVEDKIDKYITPITKIKDETLTLTTGVNAPDDTTLDIDTGLDPTGDGNINTISFITTLGTYTGTAWQYSRAILDFGYPDSPSLVLVKLILQVLAFMLGINIVILLAKIILASLSTIFRLIFLLARVTRLGRVV